MSRLFPSAARKRGRCLSGTAKLTSSGRTRLITASVVSLILTDDPENQPGADNAGDRRPYRRVGELYARQFDGGLAGALLATAVLSLVRMSLTFSSETKLRSLSAV